MQHFYVWHWGRWKKWMFVMLLALFTASFIWFERDGVFSVFATNTPSALAKGNKKENSIALTFNISWGENKVHEILEELRKQDTQATFFVSGEWAERHPDILEQITKDKHELGMLGYRYKSYLDQEISQVQKDLIYAKEIFKKLGYENITLLRPPNGHFNKEIIKTAENQGFKVIHWSVNPNDWENPGTNKLIDQIMNETSNGDILLLHASDSAKQTRSALETILPGLKNKKLRFVTISELINQAEAKSKLVD